MRQADYPLTLLYDGACPVCSLEMDHLRERNHAGRLRFVDIAQPDFDPAPFGVTLEAMNAEIHAQRPDGSLLHGMEVLRLAYAAVGLGTVFDFTGRGPWRPAFDAAYRLFARHRQLISHVAGPLIDGLRSWRARRTARRMSACSAGACDVQRKGAP